MGADYYKIILHEVAKRVEKKLKKEIRKKERKNGRNKDNRTEGTIYSSHDFGASSNTAKIFKQVLMPYVAPFCSGKVKDGLMRIFHANEITWDPVKKMYRFDYRKFRESLYNYQFYRKLEKDEKLCRDNFDYIFNTELSYQCSEDRSTVTVRVPDLNPSNVIRSISAVTHFRLVLLTGVLVPIYYKKSGNGLKQLPPEQLFPAQVTYSEKFSLAEKEIAGFELEQHRSENIPDDAMVIVAIGIEFFEIRGGVDQKEDVRSRMKVGRVF